MAIPCPSRNPAGLSEAVESAQRKAPGSAPHSVSVGRHIGAEMSAAEALGPEEGHVCVFLSDQVKETIWSKCTVGILRLRIGKGEVSRAA